MNTLGTARAGVRAHFLRRKLQDSIDQSSGAFGNDSD